MKSFVIKWRGPYSFEEVAQDYGCGIYAIAGLKYRERDSEPYIQYIGITKVSFSNRLKNHHKLEKVTREQEFWLGELTSDEYDKAELELVEHCLVKWWGPPLNDKKIISEPKEPIVVVSHWFNKNQEVRYKQPSIVKNLHDVISWDGELWRTGNLSKPYETSW